jgi:hypothetical protein
MVTINDVEATLVAHGYAAGIVDGRLHVTVNDNTFLIAIDPANELIRTALPIPTGYLNIPAAVLGKVITEVNSTLKGAKSVQMSSSIMVISEYVGYDTNDFAKCFSNTATAILGHKRSLILGGID